MKLWLVTVADKEIAGEPDVGLVVIEGNEQAAQRARLELEDEMRKAGRCRCVARYREVERGKKYRLAALIRTTR